MMALSLGIPGDGAFLFDRVHPAVVVPRRELVANHVHTLLLLALTTQTPAGAPEPPISEITVKYNKFDDLTAIRLDLGSFTDDRGTFVASLSCVYSGKARPEELRSRVNLHIYRYGETWEFLHEHQIRIVCGDDRIEHDG